ncbi:MAG: cobalamin biosynthesis protein [Promethearchaeota archaeon]
MELTAYSDYFIYITILTIAFSLLIDFIIGDPHFKLHPVNLIGNTISWFKNIFKTGRSILDKFLGIVLLISVILIFCIPIYIFQIYFWWIWYFWDSKGWKNPSFLSILIFSLIMGFLLKWTFAIKDLGDSTLKIGKALNQGDLEKARSFLSLIVRRDTKFLDESHVISATVECIAESSTDAVISVFWFYLMGNLLGVLFYILFYSHFSLLFLGIPFAYTFRIINTADSIIGYKDTENINIGWFSARMDDFSNYIPARLTVLFMLLVGKLIKKDIKNAWNVLKSDRNITESVNAGWIMGAMAGLLNVQLEKIGSYKLGIPNHILEQGDIKIAYRIFKLTTILFVAIVSTIIILMIYLLFLF